MANTLKLKDGQVLIFKDIITKPPKQLSLNFTCYTTASHSTLMDCSGFDNYTYSHRPVLHYLNYGNNIYYFDTNVWNDSELKIITIKGNQTITDSDLVAWLYKNILSGLLQIDSNIKEIFLSSKLFPNEETDRTNIVIEFDKEGIECIYTNEAIDIPALITHKRYGVFFGVKPNDTLKVKYNGDIFIATLESIELGEINFIKEV